MHSAITFFWISDLIGSLTGLLLNVFLIVVVVSLSQRRGQIHPYNWLMITMSVQYSLMCALEVFLQHLNTMTDGKMIVNGHGLEQVLPSVTHPYVFYLHMQLVINSMTFLAAVHKFRYRIMYETHVRLRELIRLLGIAAFGAGLTGIAGIFAVRKSQTRPKVYYDRMLSDIWFESDGGNDFVYACDFDDIEGKIYVATTATVSGIALYITYYYARKTHDLGNPKSIVVSHQTKLLQAQFSKSLIAQTATVGVLSCMPAASLLAGTVLYVHGDFYGVFIMAPLSWVGTVAALLSFRFMSSYRKFIKRIVKKMMGLPVESYNGFTASGRLKGRRPKTPQSTTVATINT